MRNAIPQQMAELVARWNTPTARRRRKPRAALLALLLAVLWSATAAAQEADRRVKLLAFGDSLVHGYGLVSGETFPEQLQAALTAEGRDVLVINAGNSGDTTAAGRARLDWALADGPDAVLIVLGANDGLRGLEPEDTFANLDAMLSRLRAEELPVLLAGMLAPRNLGADYVEAFDAVFPRLVRAHDVSLYPFFLDGVATVARLNQADGIHPNPEGVAVIVRSILPSVLDLIDAAAEQRAGDD